MFKKLSLFVFLVLLHFLSMAHEFWMQPQKFHYKVGESASVNFVVGENFMGEPWDLTKHQVERLQLFHSTSQEDLKSKVSTNPKENLLVPLKTSGTKMLVLESNNAFIELEADKFNEYLKEDGLDDALYQREQTNTLDQPSQEYFKRYSKLLLQVDDKFDDTYKKEVGFPIEIIPLKNPYALKKGDPINFKILWKGKPLFGVKVKVWNRGENRTTIQNIYTEQNGTIQTHISNSGSWMVSVVKMEPSKEKSGAWQSHWGSLVFGIQ